MNAISSAHEAAPKAANAASSSGKEEKARNKANDVVAQLIAIVEPACEAAGYELVDIHYTSGPSGRLVRVFIDKALDMSNAEAVAKEDGGSEVGAVCDSKVDFSDCVRVSRELSALLDVEDPVPHRYNLEVSSPGVDRPLRTSVHFKRCIGDTVKVKLRDPRDGRKNFEGSLVAATESHVTVDVDGTRFELPIDGIASAKKVPDWDLIMATQGMKKQKKKAGVGKAAKPGARGQAKAT